VNFAEAALLIQVRKPTLLSFTFDTHRRYSQGSACIYSKKVEHLYNLIYKTLDMLMSKDKQRKVRGCGLDAVRALSASSVQAKASSINADGVDADAMFAAQDEFLLLDDIIEEGRNVELLEADDEWAAIATAAVTDPRKTPRGPGTHQNLLARYVCSKTAEPSNIHYVFYRTPLSRMGTYGALSAGSRRSVFRVAGSSLHEGSGALLLDHNNEALLQAGADQSASASILQGASPAGSVARGSLFGSDGWRGGLTEADQAASHGDHVVDGGDIFDDGMQESFVAAPEHPQQLQARRAPRPKPAAMADPWAAFDLYDDTVVQVETLAGDIQAVAIRGASGARAPRRERPMRVARTSQALPQPAAAIARYGQQVAEARRHAKAAGVSSTSWRDCVPVRILSSVSMSAAGGLREWSPETSTCKPTCSKPANTELQAAHAAHKKALGRERLAAAHGGISGVLPAGLDDGEQGVDDMEGAWGDDEEGGLQADFLEEDGVGVSCLDLLSDEVVGGGRAAGVVAAALRFEEGLPEEGDLDYESKVRGHIDAYMKEATAYATQTALSARVDAWSSKLEPLLAAQEAAPAYDIHAYGDKVLQSLAQHEATPCQVLPLGQVLQRCSSTDVGRSFLALLQLANDGAVCLVHAGVDERGEDTHVDVNALGEAVAGDCASADSDGTLRVSLTAAGQGRPSAAHCAPGEKMPAARTHARTKKARRALGTIPVGNSATSSPAKKLGRRVSASGPVRAQ